MIKQEVLNDINGELVKARTKHPFWPKDIVHAAGIVAEETGELQQAATQYTYEGGNKIECKKEAIQNAAMTIRFLENYDVMYANASDQYKDN